MTKVNPLILISRAIPNEFTTVTGGLLDNIHLVLSATDIHHSEDRDEVYKIITEILVELELVSILRESNNKKVQIKRGTNAIRIIEEYGN